jgi:hypothetical protein
VHEFMKYNCFKVYLMLLKISRISRKVEGMIRVEFRDNVKLGIFRLI